jgi:malonyl-CoA reductase/3-hydroxypropionate dehydrogenase (NADP+)
MWVTPEALDRLHDHAVTELGHVDFLINNAGISGAEEMVVDMTRADWDRTMEANLISNYSLIRKFSPAMKAGGKGSILNVSSYFGGEKYVAVAVPKSCLTTPYLKLVSEYLPRFSRVILVRRFKSMPSHPAPVDGARLRGSAEAPGLFDRRGRLVLENKRLNEVHKAILAGMSDGFGA